MTEKNSEHNLNTNLDNTTDFLTTTITTTTGAQDRSDALSFVLSPEVIVNIVCFLLLSLIVVSANLLVLASVYANSRLQRPTYYMIVSLSAADLIVGLVLLPARLVELLFFEWTKQFVWCKMTSSLNLFSLSASLLNLLAFTLDRFLAIFYALKYRTVMTPNKLLVTIATVWLAAFLASFLPLFGVGTRPENTYRVTRLCRLVDTLDERYMAVYFVFVCAVPTILISVAHIKIFLLARSHERRIASLRVSNERSTKLVRGFRPVILTRDSKAAKTIAIVIGLFYLCWVPFFVGILLSIFKEEIVSYLFIAIVTCVVYSNSAINPLVYGCLDREFRNTYKQLVRGFLHLPRSRRVSQDNTLAATTRNGGRDSMAVTQGKP